MANQRRCSEYEIVEAMHCYGGGFARQLAVLVRLADSENKRKLVEAFSEMFDRYDELAVRARTAPSPAEPKSPADVQRDHFDAAFGDGR